jgi:hypothetical protein
VRECIELELHISDDYGQDNGNQSDSERNVAKKRKRHAERTTKEVSALAGNVYMSLNVHKQKTAKKKMKKNKKTKVKHSTESESDSASESPGPRTNYGRRTKKKVTAGEGLQDVAGAMRSAMTELADAFCSTSAPGSDSPSRQGLALTAIEKHENLDDEDMDVALELMMNSKLVKTYLNITSRSTRSCFLRKHIHLF